MAAESNSQKACQILELLPLTWISLKALFEFLMSELRDPRQVDLTQLAAKALLKGARDRIESGKGGDTLPAPGIHIQFFAMSTLKIHRAA